MIIYKYPLNFPAGAQTIEMPLNAEIIACQIQAGKITLWAVVNPDVALEPRHFRILGTGFPFEDQLKHLGTVQLDEFVWHIFEEVLKI